MTQHPLSDETLQALKAHLISVWPEEGCGYIKDGVFYPVANLAEDKEHAFEFPADLMLVEPDIIVHSHTVGYADKNPSHDARAPSHADLVGQLNTAVEWALCVTDGQTCEDPRFWGNPSNRPPLVGRDFIHNLQDCFSLAQDWYYAERGLVLPNVARTPFWNQEGENHIAEHYASFGFVEIPLSELQHGDALLYQVRSKVPNHIGIYVGDNRVLSHWAGRISQEEDFGTWARYIVTALRYQGDKQ
jgi:hypothetical protein